MYNAHSTVVVCKEVDMTWIVDEVMYNTELTKSHVLAELIVESEVPSIRASRKGGGVGDLYQEPEAFQWGLLHEFTFSFFPLALYAAQGHHLESADCITYYIAMHVRVTLHRGANWHGCTWGPIRPIC